MGGRGSGALPDGQRRGQRQRFLRGEYSPTVAPPSLAAACRCVSQVVDSSSRARFAGFFVMVAVAATGSACSSMTAARNKKAPQVARARGIAGVWEGTSRSMVGEGMGSGDTRIE